MAKNTLSKTRALRIIQSVVMIIVGILIACSIVDEQIVNIILGVALLALGLYWLFQAVYETKSFISPGALIGGILVGIGVAALAKALDLNSILTSIVSIIITVVGALLIIEGIIKLIQHKKDTVGIISLVLGVIALVLGLCLLLIQEFSTYCLLIFGIFLAVYGVYTLTMLLLGLQRVSNKK
jgi:uncharacterized membrane protein HdeD (DUF308 family)